MAAVEVRKETVTVWSADASQGQSGSKGAMDLESGFSRTLDEGTSDLVVDTGKGEAPYQERLLGPSDGLSAIASLRI